MSTANTPWYRQLNGYHWLVLAVCTLAWLFDCFNQQIFNLARKPAMADLLGAAPGDPAVARWGSWGTSMLLVGWATGGIIFGILGDRIGRVKTLVVMILGFSLATGACGLAQSPWQYIACCFVTGVAAGGIFPVGCTLVAESLPDRARPQALGMLQACSALGNVGAGLVSLAMIELWSREIIATPWRWMFCVGIVPALLSIIAARKLREPEAWKQAVARTGKAGSFRELFGDRRWRKHAIVGLALAASGVVGLWGIGVFSNDLTQDFIGKAYDDRQRTVGEAAADLRFVARAVSSPEQLKAAAARIQPRDLLGASDKDTEAKERYETALRGLKQAGAGPNKPPQSVEPPAQPRDDTSLEEHITRIATRQKARGIRALQWAAITLAMFNVGAFFGMYAFARITHRIGRRPTFALFFVAAGVTTATAFLYMSKPSDIFWMAPLMGAAQLSLFGGYAIYFPELFPTRLRSTGTSFCYNVGRYVAASGPLGTGLLTSYVFVNADSPVQATRYAGVAMCACFLVGLAALLFAPETKDQPLPE